MEKTIDLVQTTYHLTKTFPKNEEYGLTNQMRRAAVSLPANISEGAARQTKKEFMQFLLWHRALSANSIHTSKLR